MIDPVVAQPGPYGHLQGQTLIAARWLCRDVMTYLLLRQVQEVTLREFPNAEYVEVELDEEEDVGPRFVRVQDRSHNTLATLQYHDFWENEGADAPITRLFYELNDMRSELYQHHGTNFTMAMTHTRPIRPLLSTDTAAQVLGQLATVPMWRE